MNYFEKVTVMGTLRSQGKSYYLLAIIDDKDWEKEGCYRFSVTPNIPLETDVTNVNVENAPVFAYRRDLVTSDFHIEYIAMQDLIYLEKREE